MGENVPAPNPKRFYELNELKGLNTELNKTDEIKIFICNHCGQWNKVHSNELFSTDGMRLRRKEKKATIKVDVTPEFKIVWDKFVANFGTRERALIVALSEFHKHNR
jgi:predicted metal-binding protein